ncbi:calmodulin-like [Ruditapes philippinarum]|uniref:calmodulin-like n=1 Tax=Ruditapes philippinarum TaxID=129788 RepID=UPI00295A6E18|nr:calmodulin-like [Ruditapes philippinarum]
MANQVDSTHEANIKEIFSVFDVENAGTINRDDLETAIRCLGRTPTDGDIAELDDGKGKVSEAKFLTLMKRKLNEEEGDEDIYEAFRVFDKEGYGILSAANLRNAMTNLGGGLTTKEANDILQDADINIVDGHVDYKDLIEVMSSS